MSKCEINDGSYDKCLLLIDTYCDWCGRNICKNHYKIIKDDVCCSLCEDFFKRKIFEKN